MAGVYGDAQNLRFQSYSRSVTPEYDLNMGPEPQPSQPATLYKHPGKAVCKRRPTPSSGLAYMFLDCEDFEIENSMTSLVLGALVAARCEHAIGLWMFGMPVPRAICSDSVCSYSSPLPRGHFYNNTSLLPWQPLFSSASNWSPHVPASGSHGCYPALPPALMSIHGQACYGFSHLSTDG